MKKILILVAVIAALACLIALGRLGRHAATPVETEALASRLIRSSVLASGKVTFDTKASLTSEITGIVSSVKVSEGQRVRKGDLVLVLRDDVYAASAEQARAAVRVQAAAVERARFTVARRQRQYTRYKELLDRKLMAEDAFEDSELNYQVAVVDLSSSQAALAQARAQSEQAAETLDKTRIYSPIDGVITSIDLKEGETAIPSVGGIAGSVLMTIANPQSIYIEVNVDEADIGAVHPGDEATIVAVAFADRPLKGHIESIATSAKVAQGRQGLSFAVKIRLDDLQGLELRDGMSCRAEIFTRSGAAALAAPLRSIQVEENRKAGTSQHYVFVARDGVARRVAVSTGLSDDNFQQISGDIKPGEKVILGPDKVLQALDDGDPVVPQDTRT